MSRLVCLWPVWFLGSTVEAVGMLVALLLSRLVVGEGDCVSPHPKPIVKEIAKVIKDLLVLNLRMLWSII